MIASRNESLATDNLVADNCLAKIKGFCPRLRGWRLPRLENPGSATGNGVFTPSVRNDALKEYIGFNCTIHNIPSVSKSMIKILMASKPNQRRQRWWSVWTRLEWTTYDVYVADPDIWTDKGVSEVCAQCCCTAERKTHRDSLYRVLCT